MTTTGATRILIDLTAPGAIDLHRLARAVTLKARRIGEGRYRITGGSEPHYVDLCSPDVPRCDCPDHLLRERVCKHLLAALICERHPRVFDVAMEAVAALSKAA